MRGLLRLAIGNPIAVVLLLAIVVLNGVYALIYLPVGLFPGLNVPIVNVISHYPGAAPEEMELLLTRPIEDHIRTIRGVRRVSSKSIEGISRISAQFSWGTSLADARQAVQAELSTAQGELPPGIIPRLENIGTTLQEVTGFVVYGSGNLIELRTLVRTELASRLMGVEGVSRVEVLGGDSPAFVVRLRPDALAREHLTVSRVTAALASSNLSTAADFIERGSREYLILGDGRLKTLEDLLAVPVISAGTRSVMLQDIASVELGAAPRHYQVNGNGAPAVAFIVSKQPEASTINVVEEVDRRLEELKALLPAGTKVCKFYDQADIIREARDSLFHDLIVGALLAIGVLYFFMGAFRATLVVAATIPIALLAALASLYALGQTLDVITLSALTLAVGMVVDDAVVVSENLFRHIQSGEERRAASLEGTMEIAGPDASGTFTTVAVFAPLVALGGLAGLFVRPFGLVISAALLMSLLISLTFVPMMFARIGISTKRRAVRAVLLSRLDNLLQRLLGFAFVHRRLMILLGTVTLSFGALAAWLGPVNLLPPIDEGAILIEYIMPPGTSLKESGRMGEILEREAMAQGDVVCVYRRTGSPARGFQIEGVNRGEITMKLVPRSVRKRTLAEIMEGLRARYSKIPGVAFLYHQPTQEKMDESLSGLGTPFGVTIFGPDMNELISLAGKVERIMAEDPHLNNIVNNTKIRIPQILIRPDPVALARCGITQEAVFSAVQAARFGVEATRIVHEREEIQVLVKMASSHDASLEWLRGFNIPLPSGDFIPLERLASVRVAHMPSALTRLDGEREVTLVAEVTGSIPATVDRLRGKFSALRLPSGYSIVFTGQYRALERTIWDFAYVIIASVMLIYLIMAMQFHSWFQPLVIMVTVPLALVGAIALLAFTRMGVDVSVAMGSMTLVGIAVNNAIVLLDYANRQRAAGLSIREALHVAASVRLRPILMTASTTIFALVPVAVNPAVGSRIFQPFAVSVIGGLITSTAATLILVPVLATCSRRNPPATESQVEKSVSIR
jgi:CzcA family heavy metal efflux pump